VLEHKSDNISETRKGRGKITMETYRKSQTLFRTVPSPTRYGLIFPKIGGSQPPPQNPKLQSLLSQERVKLQTLSFAGTFTGFIRTKPIKNFG